MKMRESHSHRKPKPAIPKSILWVIATFLFILPWQACGPSFLPDGGALDFLSSRPGSGNGNGDVYTGLRSLKTLVKSIYLPDQPLLPSETDLYHRFVKGQQCSATATTPQHAGLLRYLAGEWRHQQNACMPGDRAVSNVTSVPYARDVVAWEDQVFGLSERRDDLFTSAYPLIWCRSSTSSREGLSIVIAEKIIDATPAGDGALTLSFPTDVTTMPRGVEFQRPDDRPTATFLGQDRLIKVAAVGAPRMDHDPVSGDALGLLLEEGRTNYALRSDAIDTWQKGPNVAVGVNAQAAPDGLTTAESFSSSGGTASIAIGVPKVTSTKAFTFSIYAKQNSKPVTIVYENATSLATATFDLASGKVLSSDGSAKARVVTAAGRWLRLQFSFDNLAGTAPRVRLDFDHASGQSLFLWGAQVEEGSYATSYIPTTTTPVERKAESLKASNLRLFDQGIGALFVKFEPLPGQLSGTAFDARDSSGRSWSAELDTNEIALRLRSNGQVVTSTSLGSVRGYADLRLAIATANQKVTGAVSGALRTFESPVLLGTSAFTSMTFGRNGDGESILSGHLRRVTQWNHELAFGTLVHTTGSGIPLPLQGQISVGAGPVNSSSTGSFDRNQVFNFQVDRQNSSSAIRFFAPDYDFDLRVTRPATSSRSGVATVEVAIDDQLYRDELTCTLEPGNLN